MQKTVVIVGAGITGLAAAWTLQKDAGGSARCFVIESALRSGGKIFSERQQDFLVERGPDSFIAQKPDALELCRELGLEERLLGSNTQERTTYVWSRGRLHPLPEGMMLMAPARVMPVLRSHLLSWPGKLRMGMEYFIPQRKADAPEESLAAFVRRRLGQEALDKIATPLMAGIHAADPERLSLRSTFPVFLEMERQHGGLLRAMRRRKQAQKKGLARSVKGRSTASMFYSLRGGLQQMADALAARLTPGTLRLGESVESIVRKEEQFVLTMGDGQTLRADAVILTAPAYAAAQMVQALDARLAEKLRAIRYVSTATVSLAYRRSEIPHALDGYGFVIPRTEHRSITACSWSSVKFGGRAPQDRVLLRVFLGGAGAEHLAEQGEAELIDRARVELRTTMGIAAHPLLAMAHCWWKANPQYELGHAALVEEIEDRARQYDGLYLAGAAYRGAGIPDCIRSGKDAAAAVAEKILTNRCVSL
jgi:oxygen-dependent protoporphyrinogen oxidase